MPTMLIGYPSPTDSQQGTISGHLQTQLQRCTLETVAMPALTLLVTGHTLPPPGWERTTSAITTEPYFDAVSCVLWLVACGSTEGC